MDGARAYPMPPSSVIPLFDANEDIFYIKSSDAGGFSNVNAYYFNKVETPTQNGPEYVTRAEFEELKEAINGKFAVRKQSKQSAVDDGTVQ